MLPLVRCKSQGTSKPQLHMHPHFPRTALLAIRHAPRSGSSAGATGCGTDSPLAGNSQLPVMSRPLDAGYVTDETKKSSAAMPVDAQVDFVEESRAAADQVPADEDNQLLLAASLCSVSDLDATPEAMGPGAPDTSPRIPDGCDVERFRAALEQARGRPVLLMPTAIVPGPSSCWFATDDSDLIVYSSAVDQALQLREIAHQAAHMLLGHQPLEADVGRMFPHLDPATVADVLTIYCYSEADERTAAELASRVVADNTVT